MRDDKTSAVQPVRLLHIRTPSSGDKGQGDQAAILGALWTLTTTFGSRHRYKFAENLLMMNYLSISVDEQ
jgi:hypothetical protein